MTKCNSKGCRKGKCATCKIIAIAAVIIVIACAVIYIADYYHADQESIEVYTEEYNEVTVEKPAKDIIAYIPQDPTAGFGMYGEQDGDGEPTITSEEQIERTAEEIAAWISTKQ